MADLNIHLDIRVTPGLFRSGVAALLLSVLPTELATESVTLTTYYPAPSGVYTQMITTSNTYLARDGGNVGVGTTSPSYKLHALDSASPPILAERRVTDVSNTSGAQELWLTSAAGLPQDGFGPLLGFVGRQSGGAGSGYGSVGAVRDGSPNSGRLVFYTGNTGSQAERMTIDRDGEAGIGVANPGASLDVGPAGNGTGMIVLRQTGCLTVNFTNGVQRCDELGAPNGNYYITMAAGLYVGRWELGNVSPAPNPGGSALCCPYPTNGAVF